MKNWLSSAAIAVFWAFIFLFLWLLLPDGLIYWLPAYLAYIYHRNGKLTAWICMGIAFAAMTLYLGSLGGIAITIMLITFLVPVHYVRADFWKSVFSTVGALAAASFAVVGIAVAVAGADFIESGVLYVMELFRYTNTQVLDNILSLLSMSGIIGTGTEFLPLSFDMRDRLLSQLASVMSESIRYEMPITITVGCGFGGLFGTFLSRYALRMQGQAIDIPDVASWKINRSARNGMAIVFAVTYIGNIIGVGSLVTAYDTVCQILIFVCAVQGVSIMERFMRERGMGKKFRFVSILAISVVFRLALAFVGIWDMFAGARRINNDNADSDNADGEKDNDEMQ